MQLLLDSSLLNMPMTNEGPVTACIGDLLWEAEPLWFGYHPADCMVTTQLRHQEYTAELP